VHDGVGALEYVTQVLRRVYFGEVHLVPSHELVHADRLRWSAHDPDQLVVDTGGNELAQQCRSDIARGSRDDDPHVHTSRVASMCQREAASDGVLPHHRIAAALEDHPPCDLLGVVGESAVEPAEEHDVARGARSMGPPRAHHRSEQLAVQCLHRLLVLSDQMCLRAVLREQGGSAAPG
jgi:hypothetical protein